MGLFSCPKAKFLDCSAADIIIFKFDHPKLTADDLITKLKEKNVLALATPAKDIRFVTHKDVDDEDVERAIAVLREILL